MVIWVIKTFFLYSSSMCSCHLFTSSTSVGSLPFCPLFAYLCVIYSLCVSSFIEEISCLSQYFFPSILCFVHLRRLSYLSLRFSGTIHSFEYIIPFSPLPFTSLFLSAICKTSSDNYFAFLHFFLFGMILVTAFCTMLQTSIHSSSGTLCTRSELSLNLFTSLSPNL